MLKIKDSVDLKELEKFGFKYNDDIGKYVYNLINKPLCINSWNRKFDMEEYNTLTNVILVDLLYDLIKADMVEKVEE